jgi:hypothetical protein
MLTSIEQMEANVAKFKHDIQMSEKQYDADRVKIVISLIVGAAACVGAGVALATYVEHHNNPTPIQSQAKP